MIDNVSIVIPTYNEEQGIATIIARIRAVNPCWEIIVVDDASTDNSAKLAQECGVTVVRHTYNLGNG